MMIIDVTFAEKALRGVVMEIEDAAYPLLAGNALHDPYTFTSNLIHLCIV
jgi:hypothetical protein